MNTLFILPFMPAPNAAQAGHRLSFATLQELASQGPVTLVLVLRAQEPVTPEIYAFCPKERLHVVIVNRKASLTSWMARGARMYPRFTTRYSGEAEKYVEKVCKQNSYEFARLEFSQTFVFAAAIRRASASTLIEMSVHDLQFQVVLRRPNVESWFCRWSYASERELLKTANRIRTLSDKDKVFVHSLLDVAVPVLVSMPPTSPFVTTAKELRLNSRVEPNSLIFWGAMNRKENEDAVIDFHRNVFLQLIADGKRFKLYIVGSSPGERVRQLASEHVVVTGFIEDPSELFARMAIGVVPLTMGAGVKLKTMELVEAGIPVITTPVGAEGLSYPDSVLMIRDISDFGTTLTALYCQPPV